MVNEKPSPSLTNPDLTPVPAGELGIDHGIETQQSTKDLGFAEKPDQSGDSTVSEEPLLTEKELTDEMAPIEQADRIANQAPVAVQHELLAGALGGKVDLAEGVDLEAFTNEMIARTQEDLESSHTQN